MSGSTLPGHGRGYPAAAPTARAAPLRPLFFAEDGPEVRARGTNGATVPMLPAPAGGNGQTHLRAGLDAQPNERRAVLLKAPSWMARRAPCDASSSACASADLPKRTEAARALAPPRERRWTRLTLEAYAVGLPAAPGDTDRPTAGPRAGTFVGRRRGWAQSPLTREKALCVGASILLLHALSEPEDSRRAPRAGSIVGGS